MDGHRPAARYCGSTTVMWGIVGTPTTAGTYNVTLKVTTAYGGTTAKVLPLVVKPATP